MFLEKRLTLSDHELAWRNRELQKRTKAFIDQQSDIQHVHIYLSMSPKNEADTFPLINWLLKEKQVSVYSSKTFFKERRLSHHLIRSIDDFRYDAKGIPEPVQTENVNPEQFDLVLIPLISFDRKGNRIGYGAGLYDRFLNTVRPDCLKVGYCLTPPLDLISDTHEFDIRLDYCLNHLDTYSFA